LFVGSGEDIVEIIIRMLEGLLLPTVSVNEEGLAKGFTVELQLDHTLVYLIQHLAD
jgi:hypothetical protein